jgi:uncharacterized protein involved in copper resistance
MAIREEVDMEMNGLLAGPEVVHLTKNVKITAGTAMKKGTLLTTTDGTAAATIKAEVADCILAQDVDAKATEAIVYISGRFNREMLIVASGDTVEAHEEELRGKNIYMTALK